MKAIGISGSPRKNGNTDYLIKQALDEMEKHGFQTRMIHLSDYQFSDCRACEGCRKSYQCVINDDMQQLYGQLQAADALILGSPTYFYDVTAPMKAFLDRLYCWEVFDEDDRSVWMSVNEALGGKLAAVFSIGEQERTEDAGHAAQTMKLTLQSLGYRITDCLQIPGLYQKDEAKNDGDAAGSAIQIGYRLAKTCCLKRSILDKITLT